MNHITIHSRWIENRGGITKRVNETKSEWTLYTEYCTFLSQTLHVSHCFAQINRWTLVNGVTKNAQFFFPVHNFHTKWHLHQRCNQVKFLCGCHSEINILSMKWVRCSLDNSIMCGHNSLSFRLVNITIGRIMWEMTTTPGASWREGKIEKYLFATFIKYCACASSLIFSFPMLSFALHGKCVSH